MRKTLLFLSLVFSSFSDAAVKVAFDDDLEAYQVEVSERFQVEPAELWSVLTEVSNFAKMNNSIQYVLALPPVNKESFIRVESAVKACVWFFCHQTTQLQDFYDLSRGSHSELQAIAVPEEGIYRQLDANWRLIQLNSTETTLEFSLLIKPDFWVPPLIGPWIIENKIAEEAAESVAAIRQILDSR